MSQTTNEQSHVQDAETLARLPARTLVLTAILAPCVALTLLLCMTGERSMRNATVAEAAIPRVISTPHGVWTSTSMKFSDAEMQILETRDYVFRTYTDGRGAPVDLCVVFSEDNRKGTHPPDVCLEGSGSQIIARSDRQVVAAGTPLTLRELVTAYGPNQYTYYAYFYKCGDAFTPSFYRQQLEIIWNGLTRQNAAGALIRYSTPMRSATDLAAARARVDQFLAVSFPSIRDRLHPTVR